MTKRTYRQQVDAEIHIDSETGVVSVTTQFDALAEGIREDVSSSYTDEMVEEDALTVEQRMLDTPAHLLLGSTYTMNPM